MYCLYTPQAGRIYFKSGEKPTYRWLRKQRSEHSAHVIHTLSMHAAAGAGKCKKHACFEMKYVPASIAHINLSRCPQKSLRCLAIKPLLLSEWKVIELKKQLWIMRDLFLLSLFLLLLLLIIVVSTVVIYFVCVCVMRDDDDQWWCKFIKLQ